jgi:PAS domain-containing protein
MVSIAVLTTLAVLLLLFAVNLAFGLRMLDEIVGVRLDRVRLMLVGFGDRLQTHLDRVRLMPVGFGDRVKSGQGRWPEGERENYLSRLLTDSSEPVVVTDDAHRLLAANPAALTLFGISQKNLNNFSIDAFLRHDQVHCFEREGPPSKRAARLGKCQIRPLNGKPKVVAFSFQEHFLLGRHLSKFHDLPFR